MFFMNPAARKKPDDGGKQVPTKLYIKTIERLRTMSFYSEKVFEKREFMNSIADKAVEEYFNNHFKGKIPE